MTPQEVKPVMRCSSGTQLHEPAPDVKMTSISAGEGLVVGLPGLEPGTSSLSGIFAGCVQAARAFGDQVIGDMAVTVVVRSIP